jgi:RimJ/RimL family protein N-acetyltransferase
MNLFTNEPKNISRSRRLRIALLIAIIAFIPIGYGTYRIINHIHESTTPLTTPPKEIKGKLVTLRPLKEDYYIDYHNMFSDIVRKSLEFPEHITLGYTIRYLQDQQRKAEDGTMLLYCIFDNKSNKLIGSVEIRDKNDEDPGQLGCWVNEAYWGGGRFQEALDLITKTYFRLKPNEKSYIAHVRTWNDRSYKALTKYGLKEVGYFYEGGKPTRHILEMKRK